MNYFSTITLTLLYYKLLLLTISSSRHFISEIDKRRLYFKRRLQKTTKDKIYIDKYKNRNIVNNVSSFINIVYFYITRYLQNYTMFQKYLLERVKIPLYSSKIAETISNHVHPEEILQTGRWRNRKLISSSES